MSLKFHFLYSPLTSSLNFGGGERFHSDMKTMKAQHEEYWNENVASNEHCIMIIQTRHSKENHIHEGPKLHKRCVIVFYSLFRI